MTPPRVLPLLAATLLLVAGCTVPAGSGASGSAGGSADAGARSGSDAGTASSSVTVPGSPGAGSGAGEAVGETAGDLEMVDAPAPEVDVTATMPLTWEDAPVVATGWTAPPLMRGDMFVSFAADEERGRLIYSAIDSYGTVRWRAERPAACTGFAVSMAGDTPMVALTDSRAEGSDATTAYDDPAAASWQTTASGYELATGRRLWGPVPVPGTVQGPGLVFGASAPASTLGEVGPRVALDPATGEVVAGEVEDEEVAVVGEYDGTVLVARDHTIGAIDADSGERVWSFPGVGQDVVTPAGMRPPAGAALIAPQPRVSATVVDLVDGAIVAADADEAGYEPLSRTWVWTDDETVFASSPVHEPWQVELDAAPSIAAVGTGFVYLRVGDAVEVLNASTGMVAQAYPLESTGAGFAVPSLISGRAAGVFRIDGSVVMAAAHRPPSG